MAEGIDTITTAALTLALDAAGARQRAIAANIANQATPGYVPVKVDFGAHMDDARRALETRGTLDTASLAAMRAEVRPVLDASGKPAKVHLDAEMADMAQNAVHFQALARALSRHMAILATAAGDGKR